MHKDLERNKKNVTKSIQNYMYQFHYEGNVLAEPTDACKTPGFHGTQFEYHGFKGTKFFSEYSWPEANI
jgi:hypothetical protein